MMITRLFLAACCLSIVPALAQKNKTQNVILVTLDGMRWQEVFNGADSSFMKQQEHLKDGKLQEKYWRDDLQARPFEQADEVAAKGYEGFRFS